MASDVVEVTSPDEQSLSADQPRNQKGRRRRRRALIALGVLVALVAVAAAWFVLGREQATELSDDQAVNEFRAASGESTARSSGDAADRPAAGVYTATATGNESVGLPGFDQTLGPNAPVTITHGEGGCYTFRSDFNSQHWRSWTFCPTTTAESSLVELRSWTARRAPGLDLETLTTYTCDGPVDVRWGGAEAGDTRSGTCSGRSDMDDDVTLDAAEVEVLPADVLTVAGETVEVDRIRISDTFSGAQTGYEVGEWWIAADSGLPVRVVIDSELEGGAGSYAEDFDLQLSDLTPAT